MRGAGRAWTLVACTLPQAQVGAEKTRSPKKCLPQNPTRQVHTVLGNRPDEQTILPINESHRQKI